MWNIDFFLERNIKTLYLIFKSYSFDLTVLCKYGIISFFIPCVIFFYLWSKYFNEWTRIGLYHCNFHSIDLINELKLRVPHDKWFINRWLFPIIYHVLLPFLFDTYMNHCIVYKPKETISFKNDDNMCGNYQS